MKKKTWGGVAVVVGLAIFLSQYFKGVGPGGGDSVGTGNPTSTEETEDADLSRVSVNANVPTGVRTVDPADGDDKPDIVTVVIHDDRFRLTQLPEEPRTGLDVDLDVIADRAKAVPGNKDGVLVRILLEKSAQEGAREELYTALEKAGIKPEQIQELSGFVD